MANNFSLFRRSDELNSRLCLHDDPDIVGAFNNIAETVLSSWRTLNISIHKDIVPSNHNIEFNGNLVHLNIHCCSGDQSFHFEALYYQGGHGFAAARIFPHAPTKETEFFLPRPAEEKAVDGTRTFAAPALAPVIAELCEHDIRHIERNHLQNAIQLCFTSNGWPLCSK